MTCPHGNLHREWCGACIEAKAESQDRRAAAGEGRDLDVQLAWIADAPEHLWQAMERLIARYGGDGAAELADIFGVETRGKV